MSKKQFYDENGNQVNAKEKKPFYKKWWVIAIGVIFMFSFINSLSEDDESVAEDPETENIAEAEIEAEGDNDVDEVVDEEPALEEETEEEAVAEAEIEVVIATAEEVITAFDENEVRANRDYKDKVIELTGTIYDISHSDFINESYTLAMNTGADFEIVSVRINADMDFEDALIDLNKGEQVTVRFLCEGLVGGLYVEGELLEIME